jgi:hypothetical protein
MRTEGTSGKSLINNFAPGFEASRTFSTNYVIRPFHSALAKYLTQ